MCGAQSCERKTILQRKQPSWNNLLSRCVSVCPVCALTLICLSYKPPQFQIQHVRHPFLMRQNTHKNRLRIPSNWCQLFLIQRILCTNLNLEQQHLLASQRHHSINVFRVVFSFKGWLDFGILVRASRMGELRTHQGESRLGWRLSANKTLWRSPPSQTLLQNSWSCC